MTLTVGVKFDDVGGDTTEIHAVAATTTSISGEIASALTLESGSSILSYGIRAASSTASPSQVNVALYTSVAGVPVTKVLNSETVIPITAVSSVVDDFTVTLSIPIKVQTSGEYQVATSVDAGQDAIVVADRILVAAGNEISTDSTTASDPLPATWTSAVLTNVSPILFARVQVPLPNTPGNLEAPLFTFTSA